MALIRNTYGKGGVRALRIDRDGERHDVRELTVEAMLEGDFGRTYTDADNSKTLCTDTVKNVVNVVARENLALDTESFCAAIAGRFLAEYPQVTKATVTAHETKWARLAVGGVPHAHSFVLDGNGKPFAIVEASADAVAVQSGVSGFTFMKTTGSGWDKYFKDRYTTLEETRDRICATSMEAAWRWRRKPADYGAANAAIMETMLRVFATTYSASIQDSLYRMGTAALDAVPEVVDIRLACPNKHYLPVDLSPFGLRNDNQVFLPTDEPHGRIECTVGRG